MSYYAQPYATKFPPIIPRHFTPPLATLRGMGADDPAPTDPGSGYQLPSLEQIQQWAQQYMGQQPPGTGPLPPQPAPAPSTPPPGSTVVAKDSSSTLLVAGAIALVAVIGVAFLMKESA